MRSAYTQDTLRISVSTAFGRDKLLVESFEGSEELSRPYSFSLSLKSDEVALDPANVVGTSATVSVAHPDGMVRHFNGIVSRFTQSGLDADFAYYSAELVPALWLLSLSRDRRIWQGQTPVEIIEAVLNANSIVFDNQLTGSYEAREYCVQYDESPLDFISRLMAQEGIFYFFTFASGAHTMVLADTADAFKDCEGATLEMRGRGDDRNWADSMLRFEASGRLVTQAFSGSDFDYLQPSTALLASVAGSAGRGTVYDYPHLRNSIAGGKQMLGLRSQASQLEAETSSGESNCNSLHAGGAFTLGGHPNARLNARYALRRVSHRATENGYSNHFDAFPASVTFRPPRSLPRPTVAGSHSAIVVGPDGEEIWTDALGRIKVKFHWDASDAIDDSASCWVRVAQAWAGNGWGSLFIPRIGQEVIVSYLDGDPDRPLVTGSVYNGEQATPVELPAKQMQSVIRSRPTKTGDGKSASAEIEDGRMHGNEIRFDDKKGDEELYLHAERDLKIDVEDDLETTLYKGSEEHLIKKGDRTVEVTEGSETHTVGGTRSLVVSGDESHENGAAFAHTVAKGYTLEVTEDMEQTVKGSSTIKVSGDLVIDVTGNITFKAGGTLEMSSGTDMTVKAGAGLKSSAGASYAVKAGADLKLEGLSIAGKASASAEVDGGGMLTLKGGMVKIN